MKKILIIMLIVLLCSSFEILAQGDLLITPYRVVFDGKQQKNEISLMNNGKDTTTYTISFVQRNMMEDGSFQTIENPVAGQMFAEPYLRVFPRSVTLAPGEAQVVMLQFKRQKDMIAGEYRSHLYFRAEKNGKPLGMDKPVVEPNQISFQITPVYGMSIPVIIRTGAVNVNCTLSDLKLGAKSNNSQDLSLTINRTGNMSTYGDVIIEFIPNNGKPYQVAAVNGVGVYTCINRRNMDITIDNSSGKALSKGKLKVKYVNNDKKKPVVYAESVININ